MLMMGVQKMHLRLSNYPRAEQEARNYAHILRLPRYPILRPKSCFPLPPYTIHSFPFFHYASFLPASPWCSTRCRYGTIPSGPR